MSTYSPKPGEITRNWHVIDAEDVVLGRLAVTAATLLRGKHKAQFAPHVDTGDFVVVVNAHKVKLTGKKWSEKLYYDHTLFPGGLQTRTAEQLLAHLPAGDRLGDLEDAVGERRLAVIDVRDDREVADLALVHAASALIVAAASPAISGRG